MRESTVQGFNPEVKTVSIRNNNAANAFIDGIPVFYDGYAADGYPVDTKEGAESGVTTLFAGIAKGSIPVGELGEAVAYGFTDVIVCLNTRTSTTDDWASRPAIAVGDQLIANTDNKYLTRSDTLALAALNVHIQAAEAVASATTLASSVGSGLVNTVRMKAFVRAL